MNQADVRRVTAALAWRWLALLSIWALFLPLFGTFVDHHFAERQPGHAHIYLGAVTPDHTHPYEMAHTHSDEHHGADATAADGPPPNGIVYLTSHDRMGDGFTAFTVPMIGVAPVFPGPEEDASAFDHAEADTFLQDASIARPWRPPRA